MKLVVSNKLSFGEQFFKYLVGYKDNKKLDLYAYYFQNIKDILIKLNIHNIHIL